MSRKYPAIKAAPEHPASAGGAAAIGFSRTESGDAGSDQAEQHQDQRESAEDRDPAVVQRRQAVPTRTAEPITMLAIVTAA